MSQVITLNVRDKIASCITEKPIVCGNSDYEIHFDFDEEWNGHEVKTAVFTVNGKSALKPFSGTVCKIPELNNTLILWVGVFAGTIDDGTLSTSTPALIKCVPCATDGEQIPLPPPDDVYNLIVELCDEAVSTANDVKERADNGEFNGKDGADGKDGIDGKTTYQYAVDGGYDGTEEDFARDTASLTIAKESAEQAASNASASEQNASTSEQNANASAESAQESAYKAKEAASNAENAVMEYIPKVQSRNLIPTNFQNAKINQYNFYPDNTGFKTTASPDFIPVIGGDPNTISWVNGYTSCTLFIYEYNAEKSYIGVQSKGGMSTARGVHTFTTSVDCAYVRLYIYTWLDNVPWETLLPDNFQFEHGDVATEYVLPKLIDPRYIDYSVLTELATKSDYLFGKRLVACGDSITDAYDLEVNDGSRIKSYAEITADRHSMIFTKNAVSGSTMAYNEGGNNQISTNAFSNTRYLNLPEFDYLTLWFGWNDASYSQLGTINDTDNTTFYGAYKKVLDYLITNNPTKKIGLVVPYGGSNVERFAQAVRDISKMYGVPCLDLRDYNECSAFWEKTDGNSAIVARRNAMTFDTTHPNKAGHEFLSTMYDDFIKRL